MEEQKYGNARKGATFVGNTKMKTLDVFLKQA